MSGALDRAELLSLLIDLQKLHLKMVREVERLHEQDHVDNYAHARISDISIQIDDIFEGKEKPF